MGHKAHYNRASAKGIENSSDQSTVEGAISIDHRVDVQRTLPIIINLRRETLLDAHFEVRPMRIRANTEHTGGNNPEGSTPAVQIEVEYNSDDPALTDPTKRWIGLERSFGGGAMPQSSTIYCIDGDVDDDLGASSNGKRKYFTTDLTYGTLNKSLTDATRGDLLYSNSDGADKAGFSKAGGQTVIIPVHNDNVNNDGMLGECVWIYVDECLEASSNFYSVRSAKIKVTNGYLNDSKQFRPGDDAPIYYTINQHRLYKVTYQGRTYYIEHEEEYLHNFDAYDNYDDNQTEFEGMEWGLYNTQLSFRNPALFFGDDDEEANDFWSWIIGIIESAIENAINNAKDAAGLNPLYDFYISKHDISVSNKAIKYPTTAVPQHGLLFTKNIINDINGVTAANVTGYEGRNGRANNIKVLQLNQLPHSAIEYCYNRNKRNSDGTITTNNISWYMPAIDEMEDVMMGANGQFKEFQGQYYWSCQPSFIQGYAHVSNFYFYGSRQNMDGSFYTDDMGIYAIGDNEFDDVTVGRARATKAIFVGPTITDYDYAKSGVTGYDNAYKITGTRSLFGNSEDLDIQYTATYTGLNDKSIPLYDWNNYPTVQLGYEDGNQLRSEKNRVRALVDKTKVTEVND